METESFTCLHKRIAYELFGWCGKSICSCFQNDFYFFFQIYAETSGFSFSKTRRKILVCSENVTKETLTSTRLSVESWNFTLLVYLNTKFHEKWTNSWWFLKHGKRARLPHPLSSPSHSDMNHEFYLQKLNLCNSLLIAKDTSHIQLKMISEKNIKENKNSLFNINQWRADSPCFGGCFLSDFLFPLNVLNGCISYVYFSRSSLIVVHGKGDIWYTVYEEENAVERPSTIWG